MDPISLVVGALAAGAAAGLSQSASAAVTGAYTALRDRVRSLLAGDRAGTAALDLLEDVDAVEDDPQVYERPLRRALERSQAATDAEVVAAAQRVMALVDAVGSSAGAYVVDASHAQGVQVGDHNRQTNTFSSPPSGV
jgi:hypothetical protein